MNREACIGEQHLISEMIAQAVRDVRALRVAGFIEGAKVAKFSKQPLAPKKKIMGFYKYESDVKALLHFFKPGGAMDHWIEAAFLNLNGNQIRQQLGLEGGAS